ncbi:MAG: lanthionine synthetase LanC family protein [Knoellia sp.]
MSAAMPDRDIESNGDQKVVLEAAHRCVDLLVRTAVIDDVGPTWPSWELGPDGRPLGVVAGRRALYDGDAGVVWALTHLGAALQRPDAVELGASGTRALQQSRPIGRDVPAGLLVGEAGVDLLRCVGGKVEPGWADSSDLTDGLAGILLSLARVRRHENHAAGIVAELRHRSRVEVWGRSWPDARLVGDSGRPLCGLAHGASGVAWALAEAAAVWPRLAQNALELAGEALAWEASWSDPARGGWPDLRDGDVTWPDLWCHGAAGAGVVRLRLLELAANGLEVPWSLDTTRAEAEMAVQRCGLAMGEAGALATAQGVDAAPAGWTVCHGAGGPTGVVALAADVFGVPEHRERAIAAAASFVRSAPVDPEEWPCGLQGADGDVSLLNGVAGTAMIFVDLAQPGTVPSLVLLGCGKAGGIRSQPVVSADAAVLATVSADVATPGQ